MATIVICLISGCLSVCQVQMLTSYNKLYSIMHSVQNIVELFGILSTDLVILRFLVGDIQKLRLSWILKLFNEIIFFQWAVGIPGHVLTAEECLFLLAGVSSWRPFSGLPVSHRWACRLLASGPWTVDSGTIKGVVQELNFALLLVLL